MAEETALTQLSNAFGNMLDAFQKGAEQNYKQAEAHRKAKALGMVEDIQKLIRLFRKHPNTKHQTERMLIAQLRENTGTSYLDSGSVYPGGRAWERAALRDFDGEPEGWLTFEIKQHEYDPVYSIRNSVTWRKGDEYLEMEEGISGYHGWVHMTDYASTLTFLFHSVYVREVDPDNKMHWLELSKGFPDWLVKKGTRPMSEDATGVVTPAYESIQIEDVYTDSLANHDNGADQIFQWTQFDIDWTDGAFFPNEGDEPTFAQKYDIRDGRYCIMQTHNGTDVMSGYSTPVIYKLVNEYDYPNFTDYSIGCNDTNCNAYWDTQDGGYSFVSNNYPTRHPDLKDMAFDHDTEENRKKYFPEVYDPPLTTPMFDVGAIRPKYIKLVDTEKKTCLCPVCGKGKLYLSTGWY